MLGDEAWLPVGVPIQVLDEAEVRALYRPVKFFYSISLWSWLFAQGNCHVETGNGQTQTFNIKLEARCYLIYNCILWH